MSLKDFLAEILLETEEERKEKAGKMVEKVMQDNKDTFEALAKH